MESLIIYLLLGAFAGVIAGLLGVGGGLVIVPVLVYLFTQQGMAPSYMVHMAVGTSLATIVFTSISSVRAHHKRGAVHWSIFWRLTPGLVIGALIGAVLADWMPAQILRRCFAVFEWLVAWQMLAGFKPKPGRTVFGAPGLVLSGGVIGVVSSIVGIGGGTMTVPLLVWSNVVMREAVATSSACGLPIAIAGATGFALTGLGVTTNVANSIGYLYLPAFTGIVVASVLFAPLGARLAHYLPSDVLKRVFAIVLILLGFYMFFSS